MSTKKFTGAGLAIGAATAVTALLLNSTAAYAAEDGTESAFGISASGLLDIPETPYVESEDGELEEDQLAGIDEGILRVGLLNVSAQDGQAESEVLDVHIEGILSADVITTSCFDGDGGLQVLDLELGDGAFELQIPQDGLIKNESIDLTPLVKVTFGEQTRNSDDTITVTGIKVTVLPVTESQRDDAVDAQEVDVLGELLGTDLGGVSDLGGVIDQLGLDTDEALQTITIGSATCDEIKGDDDKKDDGKDDGKDDADKGDEDSDDDGKGNGGDADEAPGAAPAPTVVEASLPVTG